MTHAEAGRLGGLKKKGSGSGGKAPKAPKAKAPKFKSEHRKAWEEKMREANRQNNLHRAGIRRYS